MTNEKLGKNQLIFLIILFIVGSNFVIGENRMSEQDSWLSMIIAIVISLIIGIMYSRIIKLNPNKDLFGIVEYLFGKIIGKIITVLIIWYAIHLGAMVVCNFTKYIETTILLKTPDIVVSLILILVTVYIAKSSITTFGKWGIAILPIIIIAMFFTIIIAIKDINVDHLMPFFNHDFKAIFNDSIKMTTFPFAETFLFLCLASFFKKQDSPYKIYTWGIILGGTVLLVVFLRNVTVLGKELLSKTYFPSYVSARIIQLGSFFTNIEGVITINFILAGITKISVCLIAAAKGMSQLFNTNNYKKLVVPLGLFLLALCSILYKSVFEMFNFFNVYTIYAIPFQIIIPLIIWIASEIKVKKNRVQT